MVVMRRKGTIGLVAAVFSIAIGFLAGVNAIGKPARLVDVLTIFATGMAGGVGLTRAAIDLRRSRGGGEDSGTANGSSGPR